LKIDVRKIGLWMLGLGGAAMTAGLVADAVRAKDDPSLASSEGIFDMSSTGQVLFFGGICIALVGLLAFIFGRTIYRGDSRVTVGRRLLQVGAPIAAILLITGCTAVAMNSELGEPSASGDSHDDGTATAAATDGHTHSDAETSGDPASADDSATAAEDHGHGPVIPGTATGDSPCEIASPAPASPGQVGAGEAGGSDDTGEHGARGMVAQAALTKAERVQLEEQMAQARTVVAKYPTVKDAEAAGYRMSTPYVPCIGAHYTNTRLVIGFNPATPSELLYDGTGPDAEIVGLSYLTFSPQGAPEGFAGTNDHWHQHNVNGGLCFKDGGSVIGGESTTEAECEARGGTKRELKGIWMAHAWVVPGFECSWGVFAGECPELGGKIGRTAWD
jgi:hypothetical protein